MRKAIFPLCGLLLIAAFGSAPAQQPESGSRQWLINGQANNRTTFTGTFVKYEGGRVYIKMPDGYVRKFIAAQICDRDLWYLQRVLTEIPQNISQPSGDQSGKLLVDLSADQLAAGPIKKWDNSGALGGAFHAIRTPLTVEECAGRKAVKFYFGPWAVPLEFQAMVSDFGAPAEVTGGPYTVATWVYNESPLGIDAGRETVFSWHSIEGDRDGTDLAYGLSGRYTVERSGSGAYSGPLGSFGFPDDVFPAFNRWHHIAYVYSGGNNGTLKIYIDGKLSIDKQVNGGGRSGDNSKLFFLGCNWGQRAQSFFTGDIASFKLYSKALSEAEVKQLYGKSGPDAYTSASTSLEKIKCINANNINAPDPNCPTYFAPEYDSLVSEPVPKEVRQNGEFGKIMEGWGQPVVGRERTPDEAMRVCAYTMSKTMTKRPDIRDVIEAMDCAARLDHIGPPWLGYIEFTTACYGQTRTFFADPGFYWGGNIMVHEMGHQFHMWGGEHADPAFRQKLFNVFWQNKKDGKWSGDYGGLNMWEYMACAASAYVSDGSEEDAICRRESFRKSDPLMFYFLQDYWPGDTLVELVPQHGLNTDASGRVTSWDNNGGLEYWGKFGLTKYRWSTGTFEPKGSPKIANVNGVTSVAFSGKDGLVWSNRTNECLIENHAWSAEFWANTKSGSGNEVVLSWGPADNGARFMLGSGNTACDLGQGRTISWKNKPAAGQWHHIVYTFKGGGLENTKGIFKIYVDGMLDNTAEFKLDIPSKQTIVVGGVLNGEQIASGYAGALAHVRVYDYDLGEIQLQDHYKQEAAYYERENLATGAMLVDFDASTLALPTDYQFRPLYPKSVNKDWLRAWANRGALGGKMSNDVKTAGESQPKVKSVAGVMAVAFKGKDRMVSSFEPDAQITGGPVTVEAWVFRSAEDKGGTIMQWGSFVLPATTVKPGAWHLVSAVVKGSGAQVLVDGKPATTLKGVSFGKADRLHFGAKWTGQAWSGFFTGAIAQARIEAGALTPAQIAKNYSASDLLLASQPSPADGSRVAAERPLMFAWSGGAAASSKQNCDLYMSTDPKAVAQAAKNSPCHVSSAGGPVANLKPGTTYYWRVDTGNGRKGHTWSFKTYDGLLVDLDASKLQTGELDTWTNSGRAGGKFTKGSFGDIEAPEVSTVDDRKAVDFTGRKCLVSEFPTPKSMDGSGDFSISLWAYNAVLDKHESMLSWGAGPGGEVGFGWDSGALWNGDPNTINYGGEQVTCEDHPTTTPMVTYWHNLVFAYSKGTLKIYENGILNQEQQVALKNTDAGKIALGAFVNAAGQQLNPFSGLLSDIYIYDYALSADEAKYMADGTGKAPDASKMLVKLVSDNLKDGKLDSWKNEGTAGGAFVLPESKVAVPVVQDVAGRKAVTFDGKLSFLKSDIVTPKSVTGVNPVTVEMLVYNPQVTGGETVFSLAPREAFNRVYFEGTTLRSLELRYATGGERDPGAVNTGMDVRSLGWQGGKFPEAGQWHHIAFTYDGNHQGVAKVYADGKPVNMLGFYTICTQAGLPMFLGTAWNTDYGTEDMFSGSLASLKVYDYARTDQEIAAAAQAK